MAKASVTAGTRELWSVTKNIDPAHAIVEEFALPAGIKETDLKITLYGAGRELVSYQPVELVKQPMPKPVEPPAAPKQIKSTEELYLTGLRLEQFHSPALEPEPHYAEALRRDAGDVRNNTALGISLSGSAAAMLMRRNCCAPPPRAWRKLHASQGRRLALSSRPRPQVPGQARDAEDWLQRAA
ncbi:MAG: hypothetical protein IPP47_00510 [Bryobacterales bacterium]|nr:hypothetical protein [Bryobacterales bacterium]